jgi:hypothetical protein
MTLCIDRECFTLIREVADFGYDSVNGQKVRGVVDRFKSQINLNPLFLLGQGGCDNPGSRAKRAA